MLLGFPGLFWKGLAVTVGADSVAKSAGFVFSSENPDKTTLDFPFPRCSVERDSRSLLSLGTECSNCPNSSSRAATPPEMEN